MQTGIFDVKRLNIAGLLVLYVSLKYKTVKLTMNVWRIFLFLECVNVEYET